MRQTWQTPPALWHFKTSSTGECDLSAPRPDEEILHDIDTESVHNKTHDAPQVGFIKQNEPWVSMVYWEVEQIYLKKPRHLHCEFSGIVACAQAYAFPVTSQRITALLCAWCSAYPVGPSICFACMYMYAHGVGLLQTCSVIFRIGFWIIRCSVEQ